MSGLPPLSLESVPGVLGRIVMERAADYRAADPDVGAPRTGTRHFEAALRAPGLSLIAEVKRASPSQGAIAPLDPAQAARAYEAGGAAAISCLTEPRYFDGTAQALHDVVAAVRVPVLRKDFVVHPVMLREAAEWGASAALLMVSVLGGATGAYLEIAHHLGLDALVEVHDEAELDIALVAGARIIGVNNRDLTTLHIDLAVSPRLIARARAAGFTGVLVAESGYRTPADLERVRDVADAVLVGTSLAGSGDLTRAARDLMAPRSLTEG
ncbi:MULTISPECIES: indole-3-glycerol phosphate synthase TrpC [Deinococcus]|uniref:indole-3-glycerol-phosphate synthase n=1 Tax=Deinococcus rufus TaxID=2136097 RepID=A0ABV7Z6U1_9DEIO|nr:indole-3-glycerol phosphate synthase TrpC [Deinococcus sp. AB2017081]WQE94496.1 indole-3-glycerol phosphate synthase TrpC [Deinococcus sp. AB2017081]